MVLDFLKATYTARNSGVSPTKNIVKLDQKIKTHVIIDKEPLKQLNTKKWTKICNGIYLNSSFSYGVIEDNGTETCQ